MRGTIRQQKRRANLQPAQILRGCISGSLRTYRAPKVRDTLRQ
jgi:hypothetical protein